MAKNRYLLDLLLFVALCFCSVLGGGLVTQLLSAERRCSLSELVVFSVESGTTSDGSFRERLLSVARGELGVAERTGRNDGKRVGEYLAYCGLDEGYEWCAAFVSWCFGQVGHGEPRTPWSPSLFPAARVKWPNDGGRLEGEGRSRGVQAGDVFGIWVREKGRIGHAGFVERWDGGWCVTVEGNKGNAVRRVRRPVSTIYRVADWVADRVTVSASVTGNREGGAL